MVCFGVFSNNIWKETYFGIFRQVKLQMEHNNLKKELKVKFMGEEGIDEGGVKKEFFQLVIKEIFDEKYGMFILNEDTRQFWFNSSFVFESTEDLEEYILIGVLLGLAIYNSVNLDVHFPFVVYKKLMGVTPVFEDLQSVQPVGFCFFLSSFSLS